MKKLTLMLLSIIIASPAFANIHIDGKVAGTVIKEHVSADKLNAALTAYNNILKQSGVGSTHSGISASGLWDVCAAAGWDIKPKGGTGYNKCLQLVNALLKNGTVTYKQVCGDDKGKTGPNTKEYCVEDFKSVKVNIVPAMAIAKMYACVKHQDCSVKCGSGYRTSWNDDYITCASQNKLAYYEFQFDAVDASVDQTIKDGIQTAVCKIHGADATTEGCIGGGTNVSSGTMTCWGASCAADASKCKKINQSMETFGYKAYYAAGKCNIDFNTISDAKDLKTAFGIDNFVFCKKIQLKNDKFTEEYIKKYIADRAGITPPQVKCDAGFKTYTGKGCMVNGTTNFKDDVKTCYAKGQQIDLVFDDVNESWSYEVEAGRSGMSCIIDNGGRFDGKHCRGLTKEECSAADKVIPGGTDWDDGAGACVLKAARSAQQINNGIIIATGVIVTVGTLGVAGAASGTILVAVTTSVAIDAAFIGLERLYEKNPHHRALQFMSDARTCKDATCAANIVKEHFARINQVFQDLNDDELDSIASEMDRLSGMLSETQYITALNTSSLKLEDNALNAGGVVLMAAAFFVAPEGAMQRVMRYATKFATKTEAFMAHIGLIGKPILSITSVAERFGKEVMYRTPETLNRNGIFIVVVKPNEDVTEIIREWKKAGAYVSSTKDAAGNKILAGSWENVFGPWENKTDNWLKYGETAQALGNSFRTITRQYHGKPVHVLAQPVAPKTAATLKKHVENQGHYAVTLNTTGHSGAPEIVIAMSQADARALSLTYTGGRLQRAFTNQNLNKLRPQQLGTIRGKPVYIKSANDVGVRSGRPICLVTVDDLTLPFYISSGTAGKTSVPTGKWEFFGGIDSKTGWFNKGDLDEIINHYGSDELRQIANMLDHTIGDVRDTEYVLETVGRQSLNGSGFVGSLQNFNQIDVQTINQGWYIIPGPRGSGNFRTNLDNIKRYLRSL